MSAIYGIPYDELGMQQHEAMSDTPETDAEEEICNGDPKPVYEFARRLERERDALRAQVVVLREAIVFIRDECDLEEQIIEWGENRIRTACVSALNSTAEDARKEVQP